MPVTQEGKIRISHWSLSKVIQREETPLCRPPWVQIQHRPLDSRALNRWLGVSEAAFSCLQSGNSCCLPATEAQRSCWSSEWPRAWPGTCGLQTLGHFGAAVGLDGVGKPCPQPGCCPLPPPCSGHPYEAGQAPAPSSGRVRSSVSAVATPMHPVCHGRKSVLSQCVLFSKISILGYRFPSPKKKKKVSC